MNLHEIFRRHRHGPLPHLQAHYCHRYQSVLFLWQHNCDPRQIVLHIATELKKLFDQSS